MTTNPVTALALVGVIAKVIADNSITFNDSRDYGELTASTLTPDEMARAVLAALSEVLGVEWGVRWDYISEIYPERTDSKHSREAAQATIDKSFATGSVVHRTAAGPWTAVE